MLVENSFPGDARVSNEAYMLTSAGYRVMVIATLRRNQTRHEIVNGVEVYRVPRLEFFQKASSRGAGLLSRLFLKAKAILGYCAEYFYITAAAGIVTFYVFCRRGFDVIHAHNPPDTLFAVALPYRLIGKKFVFDHHDLSPELFRSRYRSGGSLIVTMLTFVEWCSLKLANVTIATNESYKEVHIRRAKKRPETVFVVRNGPNERRMNLLPPTPRLRAMNKQILVYVGMLNPQDGVDYLLRSIQHVVRLGRKDFYCVIMGSGDSLIDLRNLARELGIEEYVEIPGYVSEDDLRSNLAAADICVDPDPSSPLNDVSTWIKIMEYMAAGKPIVTYDLKETRVSAQEAAVYVEPNDEAKFAEAIIHLMDHPEERARRGAAGRARVENELQWSIVGQNLLSAYRTLFPQHETQSSVSENPSFAHQTSRVD